MGTTPFLSRHILNVHKTYKIHHVLSLIDGL
jgi:hypothetical protein